MPQLDSVTFFTQFFWTMCCLFVFHFCVSKWIIPSFTRAQKSRAKIAANSNSSTQNISSFDEEIGGLDTQISSSIDSIKNNSSTDKSPKESALYLYREAISLCARTLGLGKNVSTHFYENRIQDLYGHALNTTGGVSSRDRLGTGDLQINYAKSTNSESFDTEERKYIDSVLGDEQTSTQYTENKYTTIIVERDRQVHTDFLEALNNTSVKFRDKAQTGWMPHGTLNLDISRYAPLRHKGGKEDLFLSKDIDLLRIKDIQDAGYAKRSFAKMSVDKMYTPSAAKASGANTDIDKWSNTLHKKRAKEIGNKIDTNKRVNKAGIQGQIPNSKKSKTLNNQTKTLNTNTKTKTKNTSDKGKDSKSKSKSAVKKKS